MLAFLAWSFLGLLVLVTAGLAVPLELAARFDTAMRGQVKLQIAWLFGLVRLQPVLTAGRPSASDHPKPKRQRRSTGRPPLAVLRRGLGFLRDLLALIRVRRAELELRVGTDDPAVTGEIIGATAPLVAVANALPRTRLAVTPDFTTSILSARGEAEIRFVPLALVPPMLRFALSVEIRQWLFRRT